MGRGGGWPTLHHIYIYTYTYIHTYIHTYIIYIYSTPYSVYIYIYIHKYVHTYTWVDDPTRSCGGHHFVVGWASYTLNLFAVAPNYDDSNGQAYLMDVSRDSFRWICLKYVGNTHPNHPSYITYHVSEH